MHYSFTKLTALYVACKNSMKNSDTQLANQKHRAEKNCFLGVQENIRVPKS